MLKSLNTTKLQFLIISDNSSVSYKNKSGYWVLNHIIPDDSTYSGSQISSFIEHFSNKNCDIYIMIPFKSSRV